MLNVSTFSCNFVTDCVSGIKSFFVLIIFIMAVNCAITSSLENLGFGIVSGPSGGTSCAFGVNPFSPPPELAFVVPSVPGRFFHQRERCRHLGHPEFALLGVGPTRTRRPRPLQTGWPFVPRCGGVRADADRGRDSGDRGPWVVSVLPVPLQSVRRPATPHFLAQ